MYIILAMSLSCLFTRDFWASTDHRAQQRKKQEILASIVTKSDIDESIDMQYSKPRSADPTGTKPPCSTASMYFWLKIHADSSG